MPAKITDKDRETIVEKLATSEDRERPKDLEDKLFLEFLKYSRPESGKEKMKRDQLIHSTSEKALYCIPCVLFH